MRLVVVRSGGFTGMQREWSTQVSPEEARERWLPLLSDPPEAADDEPDRFTYEISVGQAAVTIPERQVKGRWRELVERARSGHSNESSGAGPDGPGPSGRLPDTGRDA